MHDDDNMIRMRKDLHQALFDQKCFVIVPRRGVPVVFFLKRVAETLLLYHGRQTAPLLVKSAFLYARYAWTVLPQAEIAASIGELKVKVYNNTTKTWEMSGSTGKSGKRPPSSRPGIPARTPKMTKFSNTPPTSSTRGAVAAFEANISGPGSVLWDSQFYPGQEEYEVKKEHLRKEAYKGLGDIGARLMSGNSIKSESEDAEDC